MVREEEIASTLLKRYDCLYSLNKKPQDKRELVESLEIPRSTLNDIVRDLEQSELVEYVNGKWNTTQSGRLASILHHKYIEQLDDLSRASSVIDETEGEIGWDFLEGVDVQKTHPSVHDDITLALLDYTEAATKVRAVTPCLVTGYGRDIHETMSDNDDYEIIVSTEVLDWSQSADSTIILDLIDCQSISLLQGDIPFSFGLWIFDADAVAVVAFTDQGIAGLLNNGTEKALTWAKEKYDCVRQRSKPIDKSYV